jgi:chromosome partitioning protein
MSRNIGILNYKGGTGKTTTAINLSHGLALTGNRVLCIDLDPQGSLITQLGVKPGPTLSDLFTDLAAVHECIYQGRQNLDVLPGSRRLLNVDGWLWKMESSATARQILVSKLQELKSEYDFMVVDFPPAANKISENGLMVVNEIIVPMPMSHLALVGTYQVVGTLKAISRIPNHHVQLGWILPTLFNGRLRKDRSILESMKRQFPGQVARPIRNNVRLAEAPAYKKTIYEYAPRSNGAKDYDALTELVIDPLGLDI